MILLSERKKMLQAMRLKKLLDRLQKLSEEEGEEINDIRERYETD